MKRGLERDPKVQWLANCPAWAGTDLIDPVRLASLGDRADLAAGHEFMRQGQSGLESAIIINGQVEVRQDGEVVAVLGPGELVGELAVVEGVPRSADVVSRTDVELLVLHPTVVRQLADDQDHMHDYVLDAVARHRNA